MTLVFSRQRAANLKLNLEKCELFRRKVRFLGVVVSEERVATDPKKVEIVKSWPLPRNAKDVRGFLWACTYYRLSVPSFNDVARLLHKLNEEG